MRDLSRIAQRATARFKEPLTQQLHLLRGRQVLHFLHIGKTGGSAVKFALQGHLVTPRHAIYLHRHGKRLADIPKGQQVIFFLREPIDRFVSGYYSRRRQGQPKTFVAWSDEERSAFERFETPNALAEAISSQDKAERDAARRAMTSIQHVRSSYRDWLISEEYLLRRSSDIFFIGFQESLSDDFTHLRSKLALPETVQLPTSDIRAHRNPPGIDKKLTALAMRNLNAWYEADFEFLAFCKKIVAERPELREHRNLDGYRPLLEN